MSRRVDALEARRLVDAGVRTLDVLPASVYEQEHLPGAANMPLETFEEVDVASFDRAEPLLVYCFDQHCDLSARATARLDRLGFEEVNDLIGGRAAWTALGLPTEGSVGDRRRISQYLDTIPTVPAEATIADAPMLADAPFGVAVIDEQGVLLGCVASSAAGLPPSTRVEDVMVPAPGTIRPEVRIDDAVRQLRKDGLDHVLVTAVNGVLLGLVATDQVHV